MGSLCSTESNTLSKPKKFSLEEIKLIKNERNHPLGQLTAKRIIEAIKAQEHDQFITEASLSNVLQDLQIQLDDFLGLFRLADGNYETRMLIVLAILLGKGEQSDKAVRLFELYDDINARNLTGGQLTKLLEDVFDISVNFTPKLTIGQGEDFMTKEEVEIYTNNLRKLKTPFIEKGCSEILKHGDVQIGDFCKIVGNTFNSFSQICYANGVRKLASSL